MAASRPTPAALRHRNRDHERLYRPGLLSVWFLVFSVLLVVAVVAMVWKDYARPWKTYQKAYFDKQIEIARDQARAKRAEVFTLESDVQAARAAVDEAKAALDKVREPISREDLMAERHQLKRVMDERDKEVKGVKGLLSPARYVFETKRQAYDRAVRVRAAQAAEDKAALNMPAVSEDDVRDARKAMEAARESVLRYGQMLYQAEDRYLTAAADWQDAERRLTAMEKPWTKAKEKLSNLLKDKALAETTLKGYQALYEDNAWRNAPFVDFIARSIEVKQVVLNDIHDDWNFATNKRVDRCMTCHVGAGVPTMGEPTIIEKYDVPVWMQAHPGLDLMVGAGGPHPVERFGCTVCHHGVGWATDFSRAAHHPADEATEHRWKEEHGYHEPHYIEYPMLATDYAEGQCWKCHKDGIAWPVHYPERLDHGYVHGEDAVLGDKSEIGQKLYAEDDPRASTPANRLLGPWEAHSEFALPAAPKPTAAWTPAPVTMAEVIEDQKWQLETSSAFEALDDPDTYFGSLPLDPQGKTLAERWVDSVVHDYDWRAERYDRGYDTIVTYGCQGCHTISDFGQQVGYEAPPRVAPTLSTLADKVEISWLYKWILHPDAFRPTTKMPSFFWFVDKDWQWNPARNEDGSLRILPVTDAHLLDPEFALQLGAQTSTDDEDMMRLQVVAMATYLMNQPKFKANGDPRITTRRDPADAASYNPDYDEVLPEGDAERGRTLVDEKGCTACHMVPEVMGPEGWQEDGPERFSYDPLRMQGPSLKGLGSKIKDAGWLNAWLKNPRHYTATTRMPDMRLVDKYDAQGTKVADGAQMRADIIAYLLASKHEEFDALPELGWNPRYEPILREMVEAFFGKDAGTGEWVRRDVIKGEIGSLSGENLATQLARVGEKLLARNGCFGCHEVADHENENPIGVELTKEGSKDLHQLDFGVVPKALVPHTRTNFFFNKLRTPRVWDVGKLKPWADKLRMPRFNLWSPPQGELALPDGEEGETYEWPMDTRRAVTAMVAGFTTDKIGSDALANPTEQELELIQGRNVVKRYGCNQCHTVEGMAGLLWQYKADLGVDPATLPPNLFGQGYRTRSEWLVKFLKNPIWLRPIVNVHMPRFGMSDDEARALATYFVRLAGEDASILMPQEDSPLAGHRFESPLTLEATATRPAVGPLTSWVDEARALFDTINCNKCHLPKGSPGADPQDGGVAPSFSLAAERLRTSWVEALLYNPAHLINGTKMPQFFPMQRKYGRDVNADWQAFQFWLRDDEQWRADYASDDPERKTDAVKRLAEVQIHALTHYLLHHYRPPAPPTEPAAGR